MPRSVRAVDSSDSESGNLGHAAFEQSCQEERARLERLSGSSAPLHTHTSTAENLA